MTRTELLTVAKPILFNTEMVRAILDGRKTVTRRIMKPQPNYECSHGGEHDFVPDNFTGGKPTGFVCRKCGYGVCPPHCKYPVGEAYYRPYCWPGDILYVRETWAPFTDYAPCGRIINTYAYKADDEKYFHGISMNVPVTGWHPSIHMPKEAARIFLHVTDVSVERLRDMTVQDSLDEGVKLYLSGILDGESVFEPFRRIWDSTIKKIDLPRYGWDANPWVWVIKFERLEATPC